MSGYRTVPRSLSCASGGPAGIAPAEGETPHRQRLAGEALLPQLSPELLRVVTALVPAAAQILGIRLDTPGRCRPRLAFQKGVALQILADRGVGDPQMRGNLAGGETLLLPSPHVVIQRHTPLARLHTLFLLAARTPVSLGRWVRGVGSRRRAARVRPLRRRAL